MKSGHEVIIVQDSSEWSGNLGEIVQSKGYGVRLITNINEIKDLVPKLSKPILLVDCGSSTEAFEWVKKLISIKELYELPVMVTGKEVDSYEGILNRYFRVATTINTPCDNTDIFNALAFIVDVYDTKKEQPAAKAAQPGSAPAAGLTGTPTAEPGLPTSIVTIPDLLFSQLRSLKLASHTFGATEYVRAVHDGRLKTASYLPTGEQIQKVIESICTGAGKWGKAHIHRTAFLSNQIIDALDIDKEIKEHTKTAAFLYTWCVAEADQELLRKEYIRTKNSSFRKELCSKIKDSAVKIAIELQLATAGNIVATLGRIVGGEEQVTNEGISVAASSIMAADLVDRSCWRSGYWNPRGVYYLMSRFKSGQVKDVHPAVLCCVIKMLSEAVSATSTRFLLPKRLRKDAHLNQEAQRNAEQAIGAHETKVEIGALAPGMRLTRPLMAFDGRRILDEDMVLDEDLIWRIWQLSAVRPLNAPMVVVRENQEQQ